jgi:hypothetical protein
MLNIADIIIEVEMQYLRESTIKMKFYNGMKII